MLRISSNSLLLSGKPGVLISVSITVIKHCDQKQPGKQKIYFILQLESVIHGSQGWDMEVGTEAETMEICCLLAGYPWFAQPAFSYTLGPCI